MAQFQQSNVLASSGPPLSAQLPEGGSLNVGGIPRVPSLDLLRQLVQQQQSQGQNGSASKAPAASEATGTLPLLILPEPRCPVHERVLERLTYLASAWISGVRTHNYWRRRASGAHHPSSSSLAEHNSENGSESTTKTCHLLRARNASSRAAKQVTEAVEGMQA